MDMNYIGTGIKLLVTTLGAWLAFKLGALYPVFMLLLVVMALDFLTAWMRECITEEKLQSWKCGKGILKKMLYIIGVIAGLVLDFLIGYVFPGIDISPPLSFGMLVAVWLILNDLVSILENLGQAGVKMPKYVMKVISKLQKYVDVEGEGEQHGSHTGH